MTKPVLADNVCGRGDKTVTTAIDFGCRGPSNSQEINPILDLLFAIIRFLTAGVGIVIVGSVMVGGIQYTIAQGEPQKQAIARMRVINSLLALALFLFTFAIVQWLVPGGLY